MNETIPATMLTDRAVLRLSGEDVHGFLQGLVTCDLSLLSPTMPLWGGLLTPQGKALFDFILWADGGDVLVDCEAEQADALSRRLMLYRLRRTIVIATDPLRVHWSRDGAKGEADPRLASLGRRWLGEAGPVVAGWQAHRLAQGVVEGVGELGSGETLWLECNAGELNGVSYTKGCYIGQENTARMHHRGKVNRRLVVVPIGAVHDPARVRAAYFELGMAVEHRRVDDLAGLDLPIWLSEAQAYT